MGPNFLAWRQVGLGDSQRTFWTGEDRLGVERFEILRVAVCASAVILRAGQEENVFLNLIEGSEEDTNFLNVPGV